MKFLLDVGISPCWEAIEVPLTEGALVLIEQSNVRIRALPIR